MQNKITIPVRDWNEIKSRLISIESKMDKLLAEEQKELLSPAEVCSILKISRSTYHRHVKAGKIEQLKQDGKAYVTRSSLEGWCV